MKVRLNKILAVMLAVVLSLSAMCITVFAQECNHFYKVTEYPPTCTEDGYKIYVCTSCGDFYTVVNEGSALGHDFGDWYEVTGATCIAEGLKQRDCNVCGASDTKTLPITDHTDADKDGFCDVCGYELPKVIKPISPYDYLKALFQIIREWFRAIFA